MRSKVFFSAHKKKRVNTEQSEIIFASKVKIISLFYALYFVPTNFRSHKFRWFGDLCYNTVLISDKTKYGTSIAIHRNTIWAHRSGYVCRWARKKGIIDDYQFHDIIDIISFYNIYKFYVICEFSDRYTLMWIYFVWRNGKKKKQSKLCIHYPYKIIRVNNKIRNILVCLYFVCK